MGARGLKDTLHAIRPRAWQVVLGMIAFAAPWLWLLERSTLAPPTDNIEQLTWVRSLEWGYYKHPPLPTWLLWPFVQALGWSAWTTYVLGALCTLGGSSSIGACCAACAAARMRWSRCWPGCASRSTTAGCISTTTRSR